jgi:hypothetical protein
VVIRTRRGASGNAESNEDGGDDAEAFRHAQLRRLLRMVARGNEHGRGSASISAWVSMSSPARDVESSSGLSSSASRDSGQVSSFFMG